MKKSEWIIVAIISISFLLGIILYSEMPDKFASHWNAKGIVDGYMSKFWGLFLMPIISVILFVLFMFIPRIDPYKKNIDKFRRHYDNFIVLIMIFLFYIHILTIFWNLGIKFNLLRFLAPAFAILFYYAGVLIQNAKRNWFIGIRTPWTLSNEKVWNNTHKLGGKLFKLCGMLSLFGILFPNYAIWFVLIPIIFTSIYVIFYSYFEYKKVKNEN
jgi:uncharacterized membrane protein